MVALIAGCIHTTTTYSIDDQGRPVVRIENDNLLRVGTTAQIATYDPKTKSIALTQVLAADKMSGNLGDAWSRLMEVAQYALAAAGISAAAGGPTTPAAVAGGLIGMLKQQLTDDEQSEQDETQSTSDDEPADCGTNVN
jgi:hypothetical protein